MTSIPSLQPQCQSPSSVLRDMEGSRGSRVSWPALRSPPPSRIALPFPGTPATCKCLPSPWPSPPEPGGPVSCLPPCVPQLGLSPQTPPTGGRRRASRFSPTFSYLFPAGWTPPPPASASPSFQAPQSNQTPAHSPTWDTYRAGHQLLLTGCSSGWPVPPRGWASCWPFLTCTRGHWHPGGAQRTPVGGQEADGRNGEGKPPPSTPPRSSELKETHPVSPVPGDLGAPPPEGAAVRGPEGLGTPKCVGGGPALW